MANRLPTIGIEYCHECGDLGFATERAEPLRGTFGGHMGGGSVGRSTGGV